MKRMAWLTDLHLNAYRGQKERDLYKNLKKANPDIIIIGGDISNANTLFMDLVKFEKTFSIPIYFVLGNHDYEINYNDNQITINELRDKVITFSKKSKFCKWLPATNIIKLTKNTCLIGHDGWPDGRYGNYSKGNNIFTHSTIHDFYNLTKKQIHIKIKELADESAQYIAKLLPKAFDKYNHVFLLTHVPPFIESCWYKPRGKIANKDMIPFFTNKALGDVLLKNMKIHNNKQLTVLCGHTHGFGYTMLQSNILTITGEHIHLARGKVIGPQIQYIFNIV